MTDGQSVSPVQLATGALGTGGLTVLGMITSQSLWTFLGVVGAGGLGILAIYQAVGDSRVSAMLKRLNKADEEIDRLRGQLDAAHEERGQFREEIAGLKEKARQLEEKVARGGCKHPNPDGTARCEESDEGNR